MRWLLTPSDPVITDLLSGATLDNNSFVNPSQNNTIELSCHVDILSGEPRWEHQNQPFASVHPKENTSSIILRSVEVDDPRSLEGTYCCVASDGPGMQDSIVKCVQVTTQPLKGETDPISNKNRTS